MYRRYLKRWLDFIIALVVIVVLSPVYIIVGLLVRICLGSPLFYNRQRAGKDEKPFMMYKFRTMMDAWDKDGNKLPDKDRLTKLGRLLRSTSLDELPELVNILKGDMSFIGPRPLPIKYLPYYSQEQRRRHSVLPGLTGLAQINGRNTIIWEDRFAYDLQYVDNITFWGDLRIILTTIQKVASRSDIGARQEGSTQGGTEDFDTYVLRKQSSDLS